MKVGISTFALNRGESSAGIYLKSMISAISRSDEKIFGNFEIELFGLESERFDFLSDSELKKGISFASVNLPKTALGAKFWFLFGCNSFFKKRGYDAVFFISPKKFFPLKFDIPSVTFVKDAQILQEMPFFKRIVFRLALKAQLAVCVPSQFVKKSLKSNGIPANKIHIVHQGIDHSCFYPRDSETFESTMNCGSISIQRPYFVFAAKQSSKSQNHIELIKAFSDFKSRTSLPFRLVLAGKEGKLSKEILDYASKDKYSSDIFITGFYPSDNYPELYAASAGCIYPPSNEGSGIAIIEAMSSGVPVVCSKSGALPEISGENAIYFEDGSIDSLSNAIERLANLSESERKSLVSAGLAWGARFTWERTAKEVFDIISSAVS